MNATKFARCAIYTRKSTEHNLDLEFNSLEAQREACEAYAAEHYPAFLRTVSEGIASGRIRYREDITDGLENAPEAFIGMLEGRNFGKALVRMAS